jgi:nicotinate-nucleotide adenylyltransferase
MMGKRIGILGGTFDPVHLTHLHMAEVAREECHLDEVWFLPAQLPPHKENKQISVAAHRLEMLNLAVSSVPYFKVCLVEFEREGTSYTIDTMEELVRLHQNDEFFFIIGADMVEYLPKWYKLEELVELVSFIGIGRPGWALCLDNSIDALVEPKLIKVDMLTSSLSSTYIRQRIVSGKSIRFLVPEAVYKYIEENNIYG